MNYMGCTVKGGDSAPEGRYPYMLSLRRSDSSHVCGAVLVHREFALTAAHCVQPGFPNSVNLNGLVAIGAYERGDDYTIKGVQVCLLSSCGAAHKRISCK